MRKIVFLLILLLPVLLTGGNSTQLIILHTTDVHGSIYPYNYFEDKPASNGLAKVYEVVKNFRTEHKNVLLLDSGDLLQGTPMVYYFNHIENTLPNPMILTMNYMQYDAFTVGNHDIEQGSEVYLKAQRESAFPWLAANGISNDGQPFFEPYTIITRNGIKIGIIGLTTPAIPMWLDKRLYPDIEWYDMVTTAKSRAEQIRDSVDVMIGLFHAGMNAAQIVYHINKMEYLIEVSYSNSADSHFNLSSYASILARNSIFFNLYFCSKIINFRVVLRRLFSIFSASALIRWISQICFRAGGIDHNL